MGNDSSLNIEIRKRILSDSISYSDMERYRQKSGLVRIGRGRYKRIFNVLPKPSVAQKKILGLLEIRKNI